MKKVNGHNHNTPPEPTFEEKVAFALVSLTILVLLSAALSLYLIFWAR